MQMKKGVYSGYWVDFGLGILDWFEIGFCVCIVFYMIINHFLSRVKSDSIIKSCEFWFIKSVLNTFTLATVKDL